MRGVGAGRKFASTRPRRRAVDRPPTRRRTLTFHSELLARAELLASARRESLSSVMVGLVEAGLESRSGFAERGSRLLNQWKKALAGLTEEEARLVDGVILE